MKKIIAISSGILICLLLFSCPLPIERIYKKPLYLSQLPYTLLIDFYNNNYDLQGNIVLQLDSNDNIYILVHDFGSNFTLHRFTQNGTPLSSFYFEKPPFITTESSLRPLDFTVGAKAESFFVLYGNHYICEYSMIDGSLKYNFGAFNYGVIGVFEKHIYFDDHEDIFYLKAGNSLFRFKINGSSFSLIDKLEVGSHFLFAVQDGTIAIAVENGRLYVYDTQFNEKFNIHCGDYDLYWGGRLEEVGFDFEYTNHFSFYEKNNGEYLFTFTWKGMSCFNEKGDFLYRYEPSLVSAHLKNFQYNSRGHLIFFSFDGVYEYDS